MWPPVGSPEGGAEGVPENPPVSIFSHRITPSEILAIWHLQISKNYSNNPAPCSLPVTDQQQQVEAADEGSPKAPLKPPASQTGGRHSGQEKKKKKPEKEQRPSSGLPKKHASTTGRHSHPAGGITVENNISFDSREGSAGATSFPLPEGGDPDQAVRSALGHEIGVLGADAVVSLVLRTSAFCREHLIRPDVTACLINFLGVQLQWLRCQGLPSCLPIGAGLSDKLEDEKRKKGGLWPRSHKETENTPFAVSRCSIEQQQQTSDMLMIGSVPDWLEPSLAGSASPVEAALLQRFLQDTLIDCAQFYCAVLRRGHFSPGAPQTEEAAVVTSD
ncbi:uncharacterized protein LOC34622039 [Cyclospora cayetanensis]|uniref:Uncharacterized protein LOC34622039 n=1 Tax=Cyclospora cayetanensis TaxID=88456 RepID=A0A6P6RR91_9EIME|nr:uncharacterized protein LOC34622039 [Cyclospora cayetanensis]